MWRGVEAAEFVDFSGDETSPWDETERTEAVDVVESLPRARTTIEGVMGLLAAFFLGIPSPCIAAAIVAHLPLPIPIVGPLVTLLACGYLSVTVIRLASRATEGDLQGHGSFRVINDARPIVIQRNEDEIFIPLAFAMAIRLPNWWVGVRPFVAVWWLCHFVAAAIIGHSTARWLNNVNNQGLIVAFPLSLMVTLAFLFAANLYLMLAISVSIRNPGVWLIAWRYRFVVDLILAASLLLVDV